MFTTMKKFSTWLINQLNERNWSNSDLAKRSGLSPSSISMVVSGHRSPGFEFCAKVGKALDIPPEKVMRIANLLPKEALPVPKDDDTLLEIYETAKRLSKEERESLLRYILWRIQEERRKRRET